MIQMKLDETIKRKLAGRLGDPENPQPLEKTLQRLDNTRILIDNGEEMIVVPPPLPHNWGVTVKFFLDTLEFAGVEDWEYAKEHGEVVTWQ